MTRLIIDSGCDQNKEMAERYQYEVVPLSIVIEGKDYLDGKEISLKEVYDVMRKGEIPKTSQISYRSMREVLENCVEDKEDAIYLALSSKISGTYQLGKQVIENYREIYPKRKFAIVDSKGGAGGGAMIALQAMEMMKKGLPFEQIVQFMEWSADHIEYRFTLSNLDWLVKGGRIPATTAKVGSALNIRPYLQLNDGEIKIAKLFRGEKRVYKYMMNEIKEKTASFPDQLITISHADDEERAKEIAAKINTILPNAPIKIFKISAVLGTHLGIGGVGIFFYNQKYKDTEKA